MACTWAHNCACPLVTVMAAANVTPPSDSESMLGSAMGRAIQKVENVKGSLVELVEQQPATRCVVGSIPAGSALEVWPWTSVLNSLVG
jgi:hypothetical protein